MTRFNIARGPLYRIRGRRSSTHVLTMADSLTYRPGEKVWCAYWSSGRRIDVPAEDLIPLLKTQQPSFAEQYERIAAWADAGASDALWWLGWWHSGTAHCRSTWYYIAALRRNPSAHDWALDRIISDALFGCMCAGESVPSLVFLRDIPEFTTRCVAHNADWQIAARAARSAVEVAVTTEQVDAMFAMMTAGLDKRLAGWRAGVPTCNLQSFPQWAAFAAERDRKWAEQMALEVARRNRLEAIELEGFRSSENAVCPFPDDSEEAAAWKEGRAWSQAYSRSPS